MKNKLFLLYAIILVSCHPNIHKTGNPAVDVIRDSWEKYKVERVDSVNNIYLIYARKDGSLYKILSHKPEELRTCKNINIGDSYPFHLISLFPKSVNGRDMSFVYLHINSVSYYGTSISKEDRCVDDLFVSINIEGLCIK